MINFLKKLFSRNSKKQGDVPVANMTHTPAATFEFAALNHMQRGVHDVWKQTNDIDDISEQIEFLMEIRQKRVQERSDLVIVINKQRKMLGLDEIDEEGVSASEFAEDENFALES